MHQPGCGFCGKVLRFVESSYMLKASLLGAVLRLNDGRDVQLAPMYRGTGFELCLFVQWFLCALYHRPAHTRHVIGSR